MVIRRHSSSAESFVIFVVRSWLDITTSNVARSIPDEEVRVYILVMLMSSELPFVDSSYMKYENNTGIVWMSKLSVQKRMFCVIEQLYVNSKMYSVQARDYR